MVALLYTHSWVTGIRQTTSVSVHTVSGRVSTTKELSCSVKTINNTGSNGYQSAGVYQHGNITKSSSRPGNVVTVAAP